MGLSSPDGTSWWGYLALVGHPAKLFSCGSNGFREITGLKYKALAPMHLGTHLEWEMKSTLIILSYKCYGSASKYTYYLSTVFFNLLQSSCDLFPVFSVHHLPWNLQNSNEMIILHVPMMALQNRGYRGGSPIAVQAWQPCPLWEPSPSHPSVGGGVKPCSINQSSIAK